MRDALFNKEQQMTNTVDDILAAIVLHDGVGRDYTDGKWETNYEHGRMMYDRLLEIYDKYKPNITRERIEFIADMIRCHMDQWAKPESESEYVKERTKSSTGLERIGIKSVQNGYGIKQK